MWKEEIKQSEKIWLKFMEKWEIMVPVFGSRSRSGDDIKMFLEIEIYECANRINLPQVDQ
jgi:hypothetical protein